MLINSPAHVRGGLVFTTEIVMTPRRPLQGRGCTSMMAGSTA